MGNKTSVTCCFIRKGRTKMADEQEDRLDKIEKSQAGTRRFTIKN